MPAADPELQGSGASDAEQRARPSARRWWWSASAAAASLLLMGGSLGLTEAQAQGLLGPLLPSPTPSSSPSSSQPPEEDGGLLPKPSLPLKPPPEIIPPSVLPTLPVQPPQGGTWPIGPPPSVNPGPGRSWTLTSSQLKLSGSRYHGYSEQVINGRKVQTMHFTVERLDIKDLVQRGALPSGAIVKAAGAPGSTSTVTEGPIHLYTEQLTGTLAIAGFPTVPITLSPNSLTLPNVDLSFLQQPDLVFNNATVKNAYLGGGVLKIPGASISVE